MSNHQLLIHTMCPYAERSLLLASYMDLLTELTIIECDLSSKPEILLQNNPIAKVPTLLITTNGNTYSIYETIVVNNYLAALPGKKRIVPFRSDGSIDPLLLARQNAHLLTYPDRLISCLIKIARNAFTNEVLSELIQIYAEADALLQNTQYFGKALFGVDDVSLVDIAYFTPLERLFGANGLYIEDVIQDQFRNLVQWFDRMKALDWVSIVINPVHRYMKVLEQMRNDTYRGLVLPVTKYDE